ncbi:MAG: hypothetical protein VB099_02365 [Candidatus Limiplasma sp.]|nr:hypothetical protein [Candidatus Limiplasma sp.]
MKKGTALALVAALLLGLMAPALAETDLTVWLNHTWYPTDEFIGVIPDAIREKTGVTLTPTRAVDESQLGLMIASGDLMDLTFTDQELSRLSNADLCYSYSELIEKYCPDWKPDPVAIANASAYSTDGDYYFLFSHAFTTEQWREATAGVPSFGTLCYRADIAKELGFDAAQFTTIEEMDALYAAVHEKYPDMEILCYGPVTGLQYFQAMFAITPHTDWIEAGDGAYKHLIDSDNFERMTRKLNEYYRLGYINPDSFAYDESTADGNMYSGKTFSYVNSTQGYARTFTTMGREATGNADFTVLEMNPLGEEAAYRLCNLGWCGTFISRNCKDPEAAIKLMEYLFSDEGAVLSMCGREGIEYTLDENGVYVFSQEWVDATNDEELFATKYNTNFYFGTTGLVEAISRTCALPQEYQDTYAKIRERIVCEPWYTLAEPKDPDSDEYVIAAKLKDMLKTYTSALVLCDTDEAYEATLSELRENAKKVGIEALTAYMNTEIPAKKALYE